MPRRIKATIDDGPQSKHVSLGGWYDGKLTYLRFEVDGIFAGAISDRKLYRLAKAIVRQFEKDDDDE